MVTLLVLFDFSKAFDTVSHKLILEKLRTLNCSSRVIKWFASYLSGRSQSVRNEDESLSDPICTFTGVPQGSVLGPLLFTIFINDLPTVLQYSKHGIYADDTRIYLHCHPSELPENIRRLNEDAQAVFTWSQSNLIKLNPEKTKLIVLGSERYISDIDLPTLPPLVIDSVIVKYSSNVSDLGCQISSTLHWNKQINQICSRVHGALYALRFHRHALSSTLKRRLIETLVFPYFDYACAVYNDLSQELNLKLHRLLNRCVRFVYNSIPWQAPVTPYRLALGWLTVENRRMLLISTLAFTVLSSHQPTYLFELFTLRTNAMPRRVSPRHVPEPLIYSTPRTVTQEKSFHIMASIFINSFADQQIPFDLLALQRFKVSVRSRLSTSEALAWYLRVAHDTSLVLNPLPHDDNLRSALESARKLL